MLFSQNYACPDCGVTIEELTPRMFSFNNPYGACPDLHRPGHADASIDPDADHPRPQPVARRGRAAAPRAGTTAADSIPCAACIWKRWRRSTAFRWIRRCRELPAEVLDALLYGTKGEKLQLHYEREVAARHVLTRPLRASIHQPGAPLPRDAERVHARGDIEDYHERTCPARTAAASSLKPDGAGRHGGRQEHRASFRDLSDREARGSSLKGLQLDRKGAA